MKFRISCRSFFSHYEVDALSLSAVLVLSMAILAGQGSARGDAQRLDKKGIVPVSPRQGGAPSGQVAGGEACCFDDGSCTDTSAANCASQGGDFHSGLNCLPGGDCPVLIVVQACCFDDDSCQNLTQEDCTNMGGEPLPGTCINDSCPVIVLESACCFDDCTCQNTSEEECDDLGGNFLEGLVCIDGGCPIIAFPAACCLDEGCALMTECDCQDAGGTFLPGEDCGGLVAGIAIQTIFAPGLEIPDNDSTGVSHTITFVPSFPIGDVGVDLSITHTFVGDLVVTLEHLGTTITLIDRPNGFPPPAGCAENNYSGVALSDLGLGGAIDDQCVANLTSPPAYTPSQPFSTFFGFDASGDWTINVSDQDAVDTGALGSWTLNLLPAQDDPCPRRCCMDDGTCSDLAVYECFEAGGRPSTSGTECEPPQITCPPDITISCEESTDPANTGVATAIDDCDPNPLVITPTSSIVPGDCPDESRITRTWQATDADGQSDLCDQIINVVDETPPQLTCPESLVIVCKSPQGVPLTDVAFVLQVGDNCDEEVVVTNDGPEILPPTCGMPPTVVTFTAEDNCGNTATCETRVEVLGIFCCPAEVDTDLTLAPVGVDLRQETDGPVITKANFEIWNQDERRFSGTERCVNCWDQTLLGMYSFPNHFRVGTIHTDKGRARIDGLASARCPGSSAAPLLAVAVKNIVFPSFPLDEVLRSALVPAGSGFEPARLQYDIVPPTEELRSASSPRKAMNFEWAPPSTGDAETETGAVAAVGPAGEVGSVSVKGSVLYFANVEVKRDRQGNLLYDTIISLVNDDPRPVWVQLYFVQGDAPLEARCMFGCALPGMPCPEACIVERAHPGWNWVDVAVPLTANQPTYWSAASGAPAGVSPWGILDPGDPFGRPDPETGDPNVRTIRGFVVGWAVNADGQPIRWNHLSGSAILIDYAVAAVAEYNPWAFPCVSGVDEGALCGNGQGVLNLDGFEYAAPPDKLIMDFLTVGNEALKHPAAP